MPLLLDTGILYAYYDRDFSFGKFLKRYPECRETLVDLLVGNVYRKPTDEMLEKMGSMVDLPETRHIGSAIQSTT